jgi:DnaJ-class molecular chaperone
MLRTAAKRTTRQHPLECPVCEGLGQDEGSLTEVVRRKAQDAHGVVRERLVTLKQGSGCLRCGGVGRLA